MKENTALIWLWFVERLKCLEECFNVLIQISVVFFDLSLVNCCFVSLKKGADPEYLQLFCIVLCLDHILEF